MKVCDECGLRIGGPGLLVCSCDDEIEWDADDCDAEAIARRLNHCVPPLPEVS